MSVLISSLTAVCIDSRQMMTQLILGTLFPTIFFDMRGPPITNHYQNFFSIITYIYIYIAS